MLEKALDFVVPPDVVIYDLEDSVAPTSHDKKAARERLSQFLHVRGLPLGVAVLTNSDSGHPRKTCLLLNVSQSDSTI